MSRSTLLITDYLHLNYEKLHTVAVARVIFKLSEWMNSQPRQKSACRRQMAVNNARLSFFVLQLLLLVLMVETLQKWVDLPITWEICYHPMIKLWCRWHLKQWVDWLLLEGHSLLTMWSLKLRELWSGSEVIEMRVDGMLLWVHTSGYS